MAFRGFTQFSDYSIKKKLVLFTILATVITLLLALSAIISIDRILTKGYMVEEMSALSQVIAARSEVALMFKDSRAIQSNLDALKNSPEYVLGCLFSEDNNLLAQFPNNSQTKKCPIMPPSNLNQFEPVTSQFIHLWTPIMRNQKEIIGYLYLQRSLNSLNKRLTEFTLTSFTISLVFLIVGSFIIAKLQKIISKPILDLSAISSKIAKDNDFQHRAQVTSNDEVGNLSKAFNTMLDTIEKSQLDLKFMAFNDALTGLPNRRYFMDMLKHEMNSVKRGHHSIALLLIDLDGFKAVNDTIGHDAGDMVLTTVSTRMSNILRRNDIVARLGGDEFTIILSDIMTPAILRTITLNLIDKIEEPITFKGKKADVSASVGIAMAPFDSTSMDVLLKYADTAMYRAKAAGKKTFYFYNEAIDTEMKHVDVQEQAFKNSLLSEPAELLYQPIFELSQNKTLGVTVTLKPFTDTLQQTPLNQLSKIRYIADTTIANLMLTKVMDQLIQDITNFKLPIQEIAHFKLIMPIKDHQLQNPEIVKSLENLIRQLEINGFSLKLAVDQLNCKNHIHDNLNPHLIVSDNGNGIENLGSLLENDRWCLATLPQDTTDEWTLAAWNNLVQSANEANILLIAVDANEKEQLQLTQKLGINFACGNMISKPLNINQFRDWLAQVAHPSLVLDQNSKA